MKTQSIARKEFSRLEEGNNETIVNEIIRFDFDKTILDDINFIFDDWEYAQEHGINYWEDDLHLITVNELLDELDDRCLDDDYDSKREKRIKKYLAKYKGFTIWV